MDGRILVIDGSARMRNLFAGVLDLHQLTVFVASDFDEAKGAVRKATDADLGSLPDVVLVDATLACPEPDESDAGAATDLTEFADKIRATWSNCEVVFLVDAARPNLKRKLERGRIRHFSRPFQIEELKDLVTGLLDRRKVIGK